jgi:hypothetical protein
MLDMDMKGSPFPFYQIACKQAETFLSAGFTLKPGQEKESKKES